MSWWKVGKEAFDVFMNVRETIAFYMFIVEEAIQTAGMAAYMLKKADKIAEAKQQAQWTIDNLINPLLEFCDSPAAAMAYPMNLAYKAFAEAAKKTMEAYLTLKE